MTPRVVLTVAGTDSGGAAGIAADLTTFAALGVHGACVVTAVTAQDTLGVREVHPVPVATVAAQLDAVLEDLPVTAVKTGMLGSAEAVECLRTRLDRWRGGTSGRPPALVVDPVLLATSGSVLGDDRVGDAYLDHLLPLAAVLTPNLAEARALATAAGLDAEAAPADLAAALTGLGPAVVLTGGGEPDDGTCTDWFATPNGPPTPLRHPALPTHNDHGTGCTFSAALACGLAHGTTLSTAVARAASYTTRQLHLSRNWDLGRGRGPVAHTVWPVHPADPVHTVATTKGESR